MKKSDWRKEIIKKTKSVGTYRDEFLPVINSLSGLLEERDRVRALYIKEGAQARVEKVSDRGAKNYSKNPLLSTWEDLEKDCLAYWRDLGLTPAGLKNLDKDAMKPKKKSALADLLDG